MNGLLQEDGFRWLSVQEQFSLFPCSKELRPITPRPVWLVLSLVMRERGFQFRNGLGVSGQMRQIREATRRHRT